MTEPSSSLVSRREAIQRSTLSAVTLWRWEREGKFPRSIKVSARRVAYRREEFEAWLADPENFRRQLTGGRVL